MIKILAASAMLVIAMIAPAYAQDVMCDEPTLTAMKAKIDAATDAAKKEAAMKEYALAMEAMKAKKADECKAHMSSTEKSLQ
jgi:hypothetical protein